MRRRMIQAALAVILPGLAACGGDDPTEPGLDPELVAGIYTPTTLSFDPQGSLPEVNLLDGIGQEIVPFLSIATNRSFQFLFIDNQTKEVVVAGGTYETLADGIRLRFQSASDARRLLLPTELDLTFAELAGTLSFSGEVAAPRSRLFELVPDWAQEPLADPVPGTLAVEFTVL